MSARISLSIAAFVLALAACEKLDRPVDPVWGKEPCAHCAMLVGDRRYAAETVANGERRFFDDIGCFVLWMDSHRVERSWVRDADANRWIDARSAKYVHGARTPMDFGFDAHEAPSAGAVDFDAMRAAVLARRDERRSER